MGHLVFGLNRLEIARERVKGKYSGMKESRVKFKIVCFEFEFNSLDSFLSSLFLSKESVDFKNPLLAKNVILVDQIECD